MNFFKSNGKGEEGGVEKCVDEGEVKGEKDNDGFVEYEDNWFNYGVFEGFREGEMVKVMFRDVELVLIFFIEFVSFFLKKDGGESFRSEYIEDYSGINENEENLVDLMLSVGFFGNLVFK